MVTERSTGAHLAPVLHVRVPAASAQGRWRFLTTFLVTLSGLLIVDATSWGEWWSALLWIPVGVVAGFVSARGVQVWFAWLAVVAYYALTVAIVASRDFGPFWFLGAILGGGFVTLGFAAGLAIERRSNPRVAAATSWHELGRAQRRVIVAAVVAGLIAACAYVGFVGAEGSGAIVRPGSTWTGCDTPASRYGWPYEAINYDLADDAMLAADNPDRLHCASQGTPAGREVVSSDGVPIAGWYIPAASGIGPTGPTVLIAHGWKSNKSEALKYAVPFHDAYNVVLIDLRHGGRSGAADITWGYREQLDVRAMLDWLERTKHPAWIACVGNSMGGVTVLAESVLDMRVRALVLDSMHAHAVVSIGNGLEVENGHPSLPGSWAVVAGVAIRLGADWTTVDPIRTIVQVGDRPVLLTHGTKDALDRPADSADLNFHAALAAGVPVALEYCPGATHGAVIDTCPEAWGRWVTSFLAGARGA